MTKLFTLSLALSCAPLSCTTQLKTTTAQLPLTVAQALRAPTDSTIKHLLLSYGGVYSAPITDRIRTRIKKILQGRTAAPYEARTELPTMLAAARLFPPITERLQTYLPSLTYATVMKKLVTALHTVHTSIAQKKETIASEDKEISSSPETRTAHHLARQMVCKLLFIIYSPHAHPCERMHALYVFNIIHLRGTPGALLDRHRARSNRFYFTAHGTLRTFDPSKTNAHTPKRVKALDRLLKALACSKKEYLHWLAQGTHYGISLLREYQSKAQREDWHPQQRSFAWRYAAGLFKELTTIDVITIRTVTPERIYAHKDNKTFLKLMLLCSSSETPEKHGPPAYEKVYEILAEATSLRPLMERYVTAARKRCVPQERYTYYPEEVPTSYQLT